MSETKATVALTADSLKDVLKTVIEEARKPVVTEQQKRELDDAQQARKDSMAQIAEQQDLVDRTQAACERRGHKQHDGFTACVLVRTGAGRYIDEYFLCQKCKKVIHAHDNPEVFEDIASSPHRAEVI